jgi:hypothetical protein
MTNSSVELMNAVHPYTISGLAVESEIRLPGLIERADSLALADVAIRRGSVPPRLEDASAHGPTWDMAGDRFLLRIPGVARYLLIAGREIIVEPEAGATGADVSIFIIGTVFGILLHQRGHIVLHASAVRVNGKAVLFCGPSGAGKSTLAAALGGEGFECVTDDLCVIAPTEGGTLMVYPDGRRLKLWAQAVKHLGLAEQRGDRVRETLEKYYVAPESTVTEPVPLGAVYALREARPPYAPGIERPNVVDSALLLRRNAYRPALVERLEQRERYFHAATTIANVAGVYYFTRSLDFAAMADSVAGLRSHWSAIGLSRSVGTAAEVE